MHTVNSVLDETDVVVIGGGLSGCGTAYFLAKGGLDVLVVEQRNIASGASGRNGSCITKMDSRTLTPARVSKRLPYVLADLDLLAALGPELETDIGLRQFGALDIASSPDEAEEIQRLVENQKAGGDHDVEYVEREEILSLCPLIGESALSAKYTKTDGSLDPIKLTHAFALNAMDRYNAKILTHTRVEEILFEKGKCVGVATGKGKIMAGHWVVNCSNAWLIRLEPLIPIFPVKSVVSVTEKIPPLSIPTWESNHLRFYAYGTVQKEGNLIVGTLPKNVPEGPAGHFDEGVDYEDIMRHAEALRTLFPALDWVSIIRTWSGVFCMTPDRLPYIGPMPGVDHYFINTGYSNGMCYCPIGAKLTAEYILNGGVTSLPVESLKPERYFGWKFEVPKHYSYDMLENLLNEWNL
jgi:sarcosine oxidase subunit beta